MDTNKITHLLFDLGNVVFKVHFENAFKLWAEKTGLAAAEIKNLFQFDAAYMAHEKNQLSSSDYSKHISKLLGKPLSYQDFLDGWNAVFGNTVQETIDFLEESSQSLQLYAFTNSNALHRKCWTEIYKNELQHFRHVYCSSLIQQRKPEAEAFRYILNDLKISAENLLFIDDLHENILGAEQVGIKTLYFQSPQDSILKLRQLVQI
jgi:glucose-1-phosphatase